jgi:hypothetical protein
MSAVSKVVVSRRLFRSAVLIAIVAPLGLLAACAEPPVHWPAPGTFTVRKCLQQKAPGSCFKSMTAPKAIML